MQKWKRDLNLTRPHKQKFSLTGNLKRVDVNPLMKKQDPFGIKKVIDIRRIHPSHLARYLNINVSTLYRKIAGVSSLSTIELRKIGIFIQEKDASFNIDEFVEQVIDKAQGAKGS